MRLTMNAFKVFPAEVMRPDDETGRRLETDGND